jgi:hypothetical protein
MKTSCLLILALALASTAAQGQVEMGFKKRAKELRDQNNARQGVTPAQPASPQAGAAQPNAPAPLTPQQQVLARLQTDLTALKSQTTPEQKGQLTRDLMAAALGAGKPSPVSVSKLAADLVPALAGKELTPQERARLTTHINACFNSANLSPDQVQTMAGDVQAILQVAGANRAAALTVANDLKVIAAEVQKGPAR